MTQALVLTSAGWGTAVAGTTSVVTNTAETMRVQDAIDPNPETRKLTAYHDWRREAGISEYNALEWAEDVTPSLVPRYLAMLNKDTLIQMADALATEFSQSQTHNEHVDAVLDDIRKARDLALMHLRGYDPLKENLKDVAVCLGIEIAAFMFPGAAVIAHLGALALLSFILIRNGHSRYRLRQLANAHPVLSLISAWTAHQKGQHLHAERIVGQLIVSLDGAIQSNNTPISNEDPWKNQAFALLPWLASHGIGPAILSIRSLQELGLSIALPQVDLSHDLLALAYGGDIHAQNCVALAVHPTDVDRAKKAQSMFLDYTAHHPLAEDHPLSRLQRTIPRNPYI